ncbi:MAG: hypothetical protein WCR72_10610 [Bacteroidota bacterium]
MKRFFLTLAAIAAVTLLQTQKANAQQTLNDSAFSVMQADQENTKSDIELIKRLKVSGYMQAQWQLADTAGIKSFSGGNFPTNANNRFAVRRGRVKFTYDNEFSQFVLQLDATEKGVAIKDAYVAVMEPWAQFATLTAGVFDRPFGYEIGYSSSVRETPERARAFQSLFPGERDLGAKITLAPKKGTRFDFIKLDAGLFSGNGINPEFDSRKDFIGHLGIAKANVKQTIKFGFGVSLYDGGVFQTNKYVYTMGTVSDGTKGFVVDSTSANKNGYAKRQYMGLDAQLSVQSGIGITTLRGEYLKGKQPGSSSTNQSPSLAAAPVAGDTYNREFSAYYFYFIQNIGTSRHQFVLKYDVYDPNTKVSGSDIKSKSGTIKTYMTANDIKFSTLGLGWTYRFNSQVKFTAFYEIVKNETTGITGTNSINNYSKDLKDNVLTLRVQYKF